MEYKRAKELQRAGDYAGAFACLREGAALGNADCHYGLGGCYEKGLGTEKNVEAAIAYYERAAELGSVLAQYSLAIRYRYGLGVKKDLRLSVRWGRTAIESRPDWARNAFREDGYFVWLEPSAHERFHTVLVKGGELTLQNVGRLVYYSKKSPFLRFACNKLARAEVRFAKSWKKGELILYLWRAEGELVAPYEALCFRFKKSENNRLTTFVKILEENRIRVTVK